VTYFPELDGPVRFDGAESRNPLSFRHYDASEIVGSRTMADHLRFAVCYWHTMRASGGDPFGSPTMERPWPLQPANVEEAKLTMDAAFELFSKLGVPFWCFHDLDVAPEGDGRQEYVANLNQMVEYAAGKQEETGVRLLWGTANLFSHPRYQCGAATNPDPEVFAHAALQVKSAIEATHALGGLGYTFWGGREGYDTLLNTDLKLERENLAKFLHLAVDHAAKIGFKGQFYIEPKPMEPTRHQYDSDVESCLNFLREFDLLGHLKLNIETNHATLAGHSMQYELKAARAAGALGSIDANTGDELVGWDTDQFPTSLYLTTQIMLEVLAMGGFTTGGLNFDAKVRRASHEPVDLLYAHIGGMDAFARGLKVANAIVEDGRLAEFVEQRYSGWNGTLGISIRTGDATLDSLADRALSGEEPERASGRQEFLENLINEYL